MSDSDRTESTPTETAATANGPATAGAPASGAPTDGATADGATPGGATGVMGSDAAQGKIYQAIAGQLPFVEMYLTSLRREKPDASVSDLLAELDKRYVATVSVASAGVGASAAIPAVGIPIALGLGVADLLFFYEASALYALSVAALHGVEVEDVERAKPLVFGMLLGEKSQNAVSGLVLSAVGAGGVASMSEARKRAAGAVGSKLPSGWGGVVAEQMPESALAPLTVVLAKQAMKTGAKFGAGTVGKIIPFGVGAVIGGVGSFYFGRDVVKAARHAFPEKPTAFPAWLEDFRKPESEPGETPRALAALQRASGAVGDFGSDVWDKVGDATDVFRSVDLDGDGVPDEPRALTAVKGAGAAVSGTAAKAVGAVGSLFGRKGDGDEGDGGVPTTADAEPTPTEIDPDLQPPSAGAADAINDPGAPPTR